MKKFSLISWKLSLILTSLSKYYPNTNSFIKTNILSKPTSETAIHKIKKFYIQRNNLFLKLLIVSKVFTKAEKDFYNKQIDSFIKINNENVVDIQLDVDYFFLSYLGYYQKAKSMVIKHNEYFKNLIKEYKYVDPLSYFSE